MSTCRKCGAEIFFKTSANNRYVPCEKKMARAIPVPTGRERVMTLDGRMVKAEFVRTDHPGSVWVLVPHFNYCK